MYVVVYGMVWSMMWYGVVKSFVMLCVCYKCDFVEHFFYEGMVIVL